jgi:hypothetical protein
MSDRCRVSEEEIRNDLHQMGLNRDLENAQDKALRIMNTIGADSETFIAAICDWTPDDWGIVLNMLQHDYCALGLKVKQAVYERLVKECLGDA